MSVLDEFVNNVEPLLQSLQHEVDTISPAQTVPPQTPLRTPIRRKRFVILKNKTKTKINLIII
jgi:hypothetical protein